MALKSAQISTIATAKIQMGGYGPRYTKSAQTFTRKAILTDLLASYPSQNQHANKLKQGTSKNLSVELEIISIFVTQISFNTRFDQINCLTRVVFC